MAAKKPKEMQETSGDLAQQMADKFKEKGAKRVNPDIYFHKFEDEDGNKNPIQGILLDRRKRPRKDNQPEAFYYVLGLTAPTKLWDGDKNRIDGKPGMYAWVDERWCIQSLSNHLPETTTGKDGLLGFLNLHEVCIIPTGKKKLDGGRSLWEAEVFAVSVNPKEQNIPLIAPKATKPPPQLSVSDEEDIPF